MTLAEHFEDENIDDEFIDNNFEGPYWEKCNQFVLDNWDRKMDTMSVAQIEWAQKILSDCVEKRIEG